MKKIRLSTFLGILIALLMLVIFSAAALYGLRMAKLPFREPANLAQRIVNDIGHDGNIKTITDHGRCYVVEIINDGASVNLSVTAYLTNQDFDLLKNPTDQVVYELRYGRPEINLQTHYYDNAVDGTVDMIQQFSKERDGALRGFTKKELDSGAAGVDEYLLHNGRIVKDGNFIDASAEERAMAQKQYEEVLATIARLLKIE